MKIVSEPMLSRSVHITAPAMRTAYLIDTMQMSLGDSRYLKDESFNKRPPPLLQDLQSARTSLRARSRLPLFGVEVGCQSSRNVLCDWPVALWGAGCQSAVASVAADYPPASSIFAQIGNMEASLVATIGILRYSQLKSKMKKPWLNIFGVLALSAAAVGITLVANFQLSNNEQVHNTGTVLIFGFGTVVCWIQVVLTFQANLKNEGIKVGILRVMIATAISITVILYFFLVAQLKMFHGARSQWMLIMLYLLYIATFAIEFRYSEFNIQCADEQSVSKVSTVIAEFRSDHFRDSY
ncbi:transmembrane protein 150C [Hemiscyllium ocellatum]|uniref:transmembrane protein 150C n=1 Tax=Hemiscyllium ocellatum TaxID=170820 RepID=UPI002966E085|nr:transmembrane protein 150C [Hemiscyllium ocellatum]